MFKRWWRKIVEYFRPKPITRVISETVYNPAMELPASDELSDQEIAVAVETVKWRHRADPEKRARRKRVQASRRANR
jgi:hypothetical protein